jgi:hypothetical protein
MISPGRGDAFTQYRTCLSAPRKKLTQVFTAANTVAAAPNVELIHPEVLGHFRRTGLVK